MKQPPAVQASALPSLLADTAERAAIAAATPSREAVAAALGPGSMKVAPDGQWEIAVTRESWSKEKNRQRFQLVHEMMSKRRSLQTDRTQRQSAEIPKIRVRDERSGEVREVAAMAEAGLRNKSWARPAPNWGRSRERYYFRDDGKGGVVVERVQLRG